MAFDVDVDIVELRVIRAAAAYRRAEQDGTPRLWRGKALHDLAAELDDALDALRADWGPELWVDAIDL